MLFVLFVSAVAFLLLWLGWILLQQYIAHVRILNKVNHIPGISLPFSFLATVPLSKLPSFLFSVQSPFIKITPQIKTRIQSIFDDIFFLILRKQAIVANELGVPSAPHTIHKGFWRLTAGKMSFLFTQDSEMFKEVLVTQTKKFWKGETVRKNNIFEKPNVFNADGEEWRRNRNLMTPAFADAPMSDILTTSFDKITEELIHEWRQKGSIANVWSEMGKLSLKVISQAGFGFHFENQTTFQFEGVLGAVNEIFQTASLRFLLPKKLFQVLTNVLSVVPIFAKFNRSSAYWKSFVNYVIQEKTKNRDELEQLDPSSVLSRMVTAQDSTDGQFDEEDLRSNSHVLLVAGHETTTNTLSWALHFISQHKVVQQRLREEVTPILKQAYETNQPISLDQFEQEFSYCKAVIQETLRLRSPAFAVQRQAKEDVILHGSEGTSYHVPAKTSVVMLLNLAAMDPKVWKAKMEDFIPERFLPDHPLHPNFSGSNRYAFQPFNVGPRQCIGKRFAEMEMVLVLAKLVYHFELIPTNPREVIPEKYEFTMKPGLPISVHLKSLQNS